MKKKTFFALMALTFTVFLSAQTTEKTLGVRFGSGGELSYQHPVSDKNRLEFDLGLNPYSIGLTGIYHWVNDLSGLAEGMYWYYGAGASIGASKSTVYNKVMVGIAGQIGMEYRFDFPLQLSVDYRPNFYLGYGGGYGDICLSARYRF